MNLAALETVLRPILYDCISPLAERIDRLETLARRSESGVTSGQAPSLEPLLSSIDAKLTAASQIPELLRHIESFVDRRISELGTDISLSVEMMEMGENNIRKELARVRDELSAVAHIHHGRTAANTGFELEAVLSLTEGAADRIMNAAERISSKLNTDIGSETLRTALGREISEIFEACSFQDLAGQRIRKAVEHLGRIEKTLDEALNKLGGEDIEPDIVQDVITVPMDQSAIDSLFD
jgi:hypothetical protein